MDLGQYFIKDYTGAPFVLFWRRSHWNANCHCFLLNFLLLRFRGTSEATRTKVRWTLAIVLWLAESSWHIWNLAIGNLDYSNHATFAHVQCAHLADRVYADIQKIFDIRVCLFPGYLAAHCKPY